MAPYGDAVADRQTGTDSLGIQPPRTVTVMHVRPRDGVTADGGRRPARARVVVAGGLHRLHETSVHVTVRIGESSYLLADQLPQDRPAAHGLCAQPRAVGLEQRHVIQPV